jgi:hypothetical protein
MWFCIGLHSRKWIDTGMWDDAIGVGTRELKLHVIWLGSIVGSLGFRLRSTSATSFGVLLTAGRAGSRLDNIVLAWNTSLYDR